MSKVYSELFKLLDYPKVEGRIPYDSEVVHIFGPKDFNAAIKWLGSIKAKPKSGNKIRRIYWDSDEDVIALCVLNKRDTDEQG